MLQNQIIVDLSKEQFDFSALQNINEIKTLRFENYTTKIEIPLAINDYPNITELKFIGKSGHPFVTPQNLEKCIHINVLIVWNFDERSEMKLMPQLEEFHTTVENVQKETCEIATLFPNLKRLLISGPISHTKLKNQKLANETGNLSSLEELHLRSLGLTILPKNFGNLKNLKALVSSDNNFNGFPEVITELKNLESLKFSQRFSKLPDSLPDLKKLKILHLNTQIFLNVLGERNIKLTPIPEVLGKLENIEDLDLGNTPIMDITPILSLKKLKKLNLQSTFLKNCNGFSNFLMLEELNLNRNYYLRNFDGLKGLPIKKLDLSNNYMETIDFISSLESLETLDISYSTHIKDFSPIYTHPAIKELNAENEIIKKWEQRAEYSKLVTVDDIISQLESDNLSQFEEAILQLSKHVEANFSSNNNPLAGYFGIRPEMTEMTPIKVLDTAIEKHLKNISEDSLVTIFGMTFKNVGYDNYNAALLVLGEIIARKNSTTQEQIIEKFLKACENYSAGHRFYENTVHDILLDDLFAQFTSEALYKLLKGLKSDMLSVQDGDNMATLFVPAFQNTKDEKLQEKLLAVLFDFNNETRCYLYENYFNELLEQIYNVVSPEFKALILIKKEENKEEETIIRLLNNLKKENLPLLIEKLENGIYEDIVYEYMYTIIDNCRQTVLSEINIAKMINILIKTNQKESLPDFILSQYQTQSADKIIDFLKIQLEEKKIETTDAFKVTKNRITTQISTNEHLEALKIYEDFIVNNCNIDYDQVYSIEINTLLDLFFSTDPIYSNEELSLVLEKIKTIAKKVANEIEYPQLGRNTFSFIQSKKYSQVKQVFDAIYPKVKEIKEDLILSYNIVNSIMLKDESYFDVLFSEVQKSKQVERAILAFNLTCGFAHFDRKKEMLFYVKESIRLGKKKQQFLEDTDFEKYWQDADFLRAIEAK